MKLARLLPFVLAVSACHGDPEQPAEGSSAGGAGGAGGAPGERYDWQLPYTFPRPWEPESNPTTAEKVELGRHLFYDTRLSGNDAMSCATCHQQALAFTDGRVTALGSTGAPHPRNTMSLANVGYTSTLTWANPLLVELERQALVPLFGDAPVEMGLGEASELEAKLADDATYQELFLAAYADEEPRGTVSQMTRALGAFQRTIVSGHSPYDRWVYEKDDSGMSLSAKRGFSLFNSERLECFHCHLGFTMSNHVNYADKSFFDAPFHNTALYDVDGEGGYPEPNRGVLEITLDPFDMGRFKAPSLRNIAVTAPYMHDGSIATLLEVLDHYAAGGRAPGPYKDGFLIGFDLDDQERADIVAFLESLTDEEFLTNPAYANPWTE